MVIDSVHSSAAGRMHAGQIRRMKIVPHALKRSLEERKSGNLESRPSLVIRRRIMVPHLDAATAQCNSSTTTTTGSQEKSKATTDFTRSHLDVLLSRSSTQDQTCKQLSTVTTPQLPKTVHLFDLNELPGLADCASAAECPTSTIASGHSTAHDDGAVELFSGVEGDGAKLAVDLGLLPKTHDHAGEGAADVETPPRKRLRKLSEYQPALVKTPEPEVKKVDDEEVIGAASVLMTLSSSKKRCLDSIADGESGGEDGAGPTSSETTSSRSLGSGGSVLLRPSNKQRYRSMGELMAQAPGLY